MFLGCNTDGLRAIADAMDRAARALAAIAAGIAWGVEAVPWEGPDAEAYRLEVRAGILEGLERAIEEWRERAEEARRHAQEQDEASAPEPADTAPAGTSPSAPTAPATPAAPTLPRLPFGLYARRPGLLDRVLPVDPGPSRGWFQDSLGEETGAHAERDWAKLSAQAGAASATPSPIGSAEAIVVDAANARLGEYEVSQGLRDGDHAAVVDGLITARLAKADGIFATLELTPLAPLGVAGSSVTGSLNGAWWGLRGAALAEEEDGGTSRGSATRYLMQTPRRLDEETIQPLAEKLPAPLGRPISQAGTTLAEVEREAEDGWDRASATQRDMLLAVPGVEETLSLPRRIAESPRHSIERIREAHGW